MKKYGVIYKITNTVNGKVYIGQTVNSFNRRYIDGIKGTHNEHLKRSIKKYGSEKFVVDEEYYIAYSKEELDEKEKELIKKYNSCDARYGYNKRLGGSNGKHTEETKKKMREKCIGRYKGELNPMYGMRGELSPGARKVILLNTREVFVSAKEASLKYNIDSSSITTCCKNKMKSSGKRYMNKEPLVWEYYDENKIITDEYIKNRILEARENISKSVILTNTGEIFQSISDASRTYGVDASSLTKCCRGKLASRGKHPKTGEKLKWMYYTDYIKNTTDV